MSKCQRGVHEAGGFLDLQVTDDGNEERSKLTSKIERRRALLFDKGSAAIRSDQSEKRVIIVISFRSDVGRNECALK